MRLSEVCTRVVRLPLGAGRGGSGATSVELLLVTVRDKDGAEGTGYTYSLDGGLDAAERVVHSLFLPRLAGLRTEEWERRWHDLWAASHRLGRGFALPALSALDIAVWDLRGRTAGQPLYQLLGAQRETVPIYGGGRATHTMSDDELVAGASSYVAEGFREIKLRAGALGLDRDLERIAAVRDAVGHGIRLMVDCNERLTLAEALWFAHRLAELGVFWLEEPLPADHVAGYAQLAARSPVPIAAGEHLQGRFEFKNYFDHSAIAIAMPDAPLTGGISEVMRIATLAEASAVTISPHFLPELHVHIAAAVRGPASIEHFPLIDDLLGETLQVHEGVVSPPQRPGHGIIWDDGAIERYAITGGTVTPISPT